jgi:hypothetical protein
MTRLRLGGTVVTNDFGKDLVSKSDDIAQGKMGSGRISMGSYTSANQYCQGFFSRVEDDAEYSPLSLGSRLDQSRSVARHLIDLDIDPIACFPSAPCGDGERVRDQQHLEILALDGIHGQ